MSYQINWLPFEPVSGANCKWELIVRRATDSKSGATSNHHEDCRTFETKNQAQSYLTQLTEGQVDEGGTITIRAVEC